MPTDPIDQLNIPNTGACAAESPSPSAARYGQSPDGSGLGHTPDGPVMQPVNLAGRVLVRRDVFWNNVVRDILMAMASAAASSAGRISPSVTGAETSTSPLDSMFDGRVGIMTTLGQRIPIADVYPVFSCSSVQRGVDRSIADDVQCSIFRIKTPTGESYTLPLSQIIGVHSLSDELVEQLENDAEEMAAVDTDHIERAPFGFAAYTSLARAENQEQAHDEEEKSVSEGE